MGGAIINGIEWKYKAPTELVLRHRRSFHACQKKSFETVEQWFCRIEKCIDVCEFGDHHEFLFIDKFISGLNETVFDTLIQNETLTREKTLSIAVQSQRLLSPNTIYLENTYEPPDDVNERLTVDVESELVRQTSCFKYKREIHGQSNDFVILFDLILCKFAGQ